jgi:uroporphyrinogen decarboxylase
MNSKERVLCTLAHQEPDRVPLDTWMTAEGREALRLHFRLPPEDDPYEQWHEGLMQRFRVDFRFPKLPYIGRPLRTFADGSWETEWGFRRKGLYAGVSITHPLAQAASVESIVHYPFPDPDWYDYSGLAHYCATHRQYALVGGSWSPFFTQACHLMGMERLLLNLYDAPELVSALLHRLVEFHIAVSERMFAAAPGHFDIMFVGDDYGGSIGLLMKPAHWRSIVKPELQRLVDLAHSNGLKFMLHCDGAIRQIIPDLIEMGVDALNPIEPEAAGMEPAEIKGLFGKQIALHGTVSLATTLALGTPVQVCQEIYRLLELCAPGGGLILCPANYLLPDIPPANVLALYDTAYEAGHYPIQRQYAV